MSTSITESEGWGRAPDPQGLLAQPGLLRAALDAVPDAVLIVDHDGLIVAANVQVQPVFDYEPSDLEGQPVEVLVPTRARPGHPRRRSSYHRRPMGLLQLAALKRDGTEFPAEISLGPIGRTAGGGAELTVVTVRDITSRLALEAEADRMRDELLAIVTHELRTPLTSIIGYTELLEEHFSGRLGDDGEAMLAAISRNAHRQRRLVSDLLTLAVASLGNLSLQREETDVVALVEEVLEEVRPAADRGGVLVTSRTPEICRAWIDRVRFRQAVENLVSNAIKFSPAGSSVVVSADCAEEHFVLRVIDEGEGIEPADLDRIFDRLYRGRNAMRGEHQGVGLGLALVKAIVDEHGGEIGIDSTPGVGTTVTIRVPLGLSD